MIDDLGDETTIGPTPDRVRRLLKDRHSRKRTTLVTTNLPEPAFVERYDDHVLDRVRAGGGYVHIRGRSRRRPGAAPILTRITAACRIAELVAVVDTMTGAGARVADRRALDEIQALFEVGEAELEQAQRRRAAWSVGDPLQIAMSEGRTP